MKSSLASVDKHLNHLSSWWASTVPGWWCNITPPHVSGGDIIYCVTRVKWRLCNVGRQQVRSLARNVAKFRCVGCHVTNQAGSSLFICFCPCTHKATKLFGLSYPAWKNHNIMMLELCTGTESVRTVRDIDIFRDFSWSIKFARHRASLLIQPQTIADCAWWKSTWFFQPAVASLNQRYCFQAGCKCLLLILFKNKLEKNLEWKKV